MSQTNRRFDINAYASSLTGGSRLAAAVLLVGLGIFMFFWPATSTILVIRIVGIVLLLLGGQYLLSWYRSRSTDRSLMLFGGAVALVGLFLLLFPGLIRSILNIAAGVFLLLYGFSALSTMTIERRSGSGQWIFAAAVACITLVLGFICLFSGTATNTIVRIVGAALIVNGIFQYLASR